MRSLERNLSLEYILSQAFLVTELFHYYFLIKPFLKIILTFKSQVKHANVSPENSKVSGSTNFSHPFYGNNKRQIHKECLLRISFNDHLQLIIP